MLRHYLGRGVIMRQHTFAACHFFFRYQGAFPFDPIEDHGGKDAVAIFIEHLRRVGIQQRRLTTVGEKVGLPARERSSEGPAAPAVDPVGGNHREMEVGRHFQKDLELINLRLVFRCREVEFDEAVHGFLAGSFADTQVSRLTSGRADSAGLEAHFVESAVLWPRLPKPVLLECDLDPAGEHQGAKWSFDTETVQGFLLFLPATVAQIGGCLADFSGFAGRGGKGTIEDEIRRAVVAIHVRWRERELRADTLKSMPQGILIQLPWLRRIIAHPEQVIDRILIFLPAQTIVGHLGSRGHPRRFAFFDPGVEFPDEPRDFILFWLRLVFRWHFATVDFFDNFRPEMRVFAPLKITRKLIEAQVALFLVRPVTAGTVPLDKDLERFLGRDHGHQGEEWKKGKTIPDHGHVGSSPYRGAC